MIAAADCPFKANITCQLALQNAGSRGVRELASIRPLLRWKSSFRPARRPARPLLAEQ